MAAAGQRGRHRAPRVQRGGRHESKEGEQAHHGQGGKGAAVVGTGTEEPPAGDHVPADRRPGGHVAGGEANHDGARPVVRPGNDRRSEPVGHQQDQRGHEGESPNRGRPHRGKRSVPFQRPDWYRHAGSGSAVGADGVPGGTVGAGWRRPSLGALVSPTRSRSGCRSHGAGLTGRTDRVRLAQDRRTLSRTCSPRRDPGGQRRKPDQPCVLAPTHTLWFYAYGFEL
jgi:hypothetical protein